MILEHLSPELYQLGEEHQLGAPVEVYKRFETLAGKVAFTGILLLAISIIGMIIIFLGTPDSVANLPLTLAGFCQGLFGVGMFLSLIRHEDMITPLHPRLSVTVYTDGLLYRKGSKIQIVYWEQIKSIRRQFTVYRRKKKIVLIRPVYTCELSERPDLVLSAAITRVDEIGTVIERELTRRFLSQVQTDYQAGRPVHFSALTLDQQGIDYGEKDVDWERVSSIGVGPEKLVIEKDGIHAEWLTISLTDISNLCVLEVLLKDIRREKGFDLFLKEEGITQNSETIEGFRSKRSAQYPRKTSWVSTLILVVLVLLVIGVETSNVITNFQRSEQQPVLKSYPASTSYSVHPTPLPGLPYTAESVYDAFLAAGIKTSDVEYADGWYHYATYQPEGKLITWEEAYGIVLEIATFATPIEVKTDATDLLNSSSSYSVYTRNLCLFFYDSSIVDAHIAAYEKIMSKVCK